MLLAAITAQASNTTDIGGQVKDEHGNPMPYTNVVLLTSDSSFVSGATTDDNGRFHITSAQSDGILKVSCIGYATQYMNVESCQSANVIISLSPEAQTLKEVVVKSDLPKTRVKGDAMQTIVDGTILEKAGVATDVLNRIPQLSMNKEGSVEVFGRGAAEVYINGRKVQDQKELSRLTSDQIKSVEVVSNPGARYAASTKAVVRIYLKKRQGEGFSFIERADVSYHYAWSPFNNLDVNYRIGGFDITGSFWAGSQHSKSLQENEVTYYVGQDKYYNHAWQNNQSRWNGWSPQLQVNYMIDEDHSFGAFYKYDRHPRHTNGGAFNTDIYENGSLIEESRNTIAEVDEFKKHIFNAYYLGKVGKLTIDLNLDGLFDDSSKPNSSDDVTTSVGSSVSTRTHVDNYSDASDHFLASKLILTYPLWKGSLSVGSEYSHNSRNDKYSYAASDGSGQAKTLPVTATDTDIRETFISGFAEYGRSFGKLFAQVGLRYEYLKNDYSDFGIHDDEKSRRYGDWFPTATLSRPFGKMQLSLSYRRDIQRPAYDNLSSQTFYLNRYAYQSGNPYLEPMLTHSLALNAAYKAFSFSAYYQHVTNVFSMENMAFPDSDDPLISLVKPVNGKAYNSMTYYAAYRPTIGGWHPMWSVAMVTQDYETLNAKHETTKLNKPLLELQWKNDIELPKKWRLNIGMNFIMHGDQANMRINKNMLNTNLGIQHDINLKRAGELTFDIRAVDIFNTNKTSVVFFGERELTAVNPARRSFSMNLTWRFNAANSKYRGKGAGESQKARM